MMVLIFIIKGEMYPCAYVFLENKTAEVYERMFKLIIKNPYNHILNPTIIMSDFENGLISAAKECFPNARHVVRYIEILLCV